MQGPEEGTLHNEENLKQQKGIEENVYSSLSKHLFTSKLNAGVHSLYNQGIFPHIQQRKRNFVLIKRFARVLSTKENRSFEQRSTKTP